MATTEIKLPRFGARRQLELYQSLTEIGKESRIATKSEAKIIRTRQYMEAMLRDGSVPTSHGDDPLSITLRALTELELQADQERRELKLQITRKIKAELKAYLTDIECQEAELDNSRGTPMFAADEALKARARANIETKERARMERLRTKIARNREPTEGEAEQLIVTVMEEVVSPHHAKAIS